MGERKDYVIVAPKYSKSNGVRTLYLLAQELEKKGYRAFVFAPKTNEVDCQFINRVTKNMQKNAIVVYPETVFGNPLAFDNVVRYILYYPQKLGGTKNFNKNELLITYSKEYYSDAEELFFPCLDKKLFYADDTKKDVDCYFVYKKGKWRDIKEFDSMIEINAKFPEKREDLASLLRRTKTLYSYDDHTLLLDEAYACGCKVKIVTESGFADYVSRYDEYFKDYEQNLDNFIKKSQKMKNGQYQKSLSFENVSFKQIFDYCKCMIMYRLFLFLNDEEKAMKNFWKAEKKLRVKGNERKAV